MCCLFVFFFLILQSLYSLSSMFLTDIIKQSYSKPECVMVALEWHVTEVTFCIQNRYKEMYELFCKTKSSSLKTCSALPLCLWSSHWDGPPLPSPLRPTHTWHSLSQWWLYLLPIISVHVFRLQWVYFGLL